MKKILTYLKKAYEWAAAILKNRMGDFCLTLLYTGLLALIRPIASFVVLFSVIYAILARFGDIDRDSIWAAVFGGFTMQVLIWLYLIIW
jgi:hypothetical protein